MSLDRSAGIVLAWPECWRRHSAHVVPIPPTTRTRMSASTAGRRQAMGQDRAGSPVGSSSWALANFPAASSMEAKAMPEISAMSSSVYTPSE